MRTLCAIAIVMGGVLALNAAAGAEPPRKGKAAETKRTVRPPPQQSREEVECERARFFDPTGEFASYPCWAREALSKRGSDW
jgi:hypothetical protein